MAEYYTPGVYTEKLKNKSLVIQGVSTSVAAFVGTAKRGKVNTPVYITSWNDFIENFAYGLESAFDKNSYLAFSVYQFFNNGGSRCYVSLASTSDLATASAEVKAGTDDAITFSAKDGGAWGNSLKISCKKNEIEENTFDLTITNGIETETHSQLSNEEGSEKYFIDYLKTYSKFINVVTGSKLSEFDETSFTGGKDSGECSDNDYLKALQAFDAVDDATLFAIPGQTGINVVRGLLDYVDNHNFTFAAIDPPMGTTTATELKELRKKYSCERAVLLNTWIKVNDPLSSVSGKLRTIPPSGFYLGVVARTIEESGPWEAPAGTKATVNGAIELVFDPKKGDTDMLNPLGIISILTKPNFGICVWGARAITSDSNYKYVSDILFDIYIRKSVQESTQPFVFELNRGTGRFPEATLWSRIIATCESFLNYIWEQGGLKGNTSSDAYYVKCDEELNPESMVGRGYCITEIGYASAKPAEFVVFRFKNSLS